MLRFFFDRFSKVALMVEGVGLLLTFGWISELDNRPFCFLERLLLVFYLLEYIFLRFCASWRWHPEENRFDGLELHFKKILIPASYILAIFSAAGYFFNVAKHLWIALILLSPMVYVNATLLYLFWKDPNKTPVNFYSGRKFHLDNRRSKG